MTGTRSRVGKRLGLLLGTMVVLLGATEVSLRLWWPVSYRAPVEETDESGWSGYLHRPSPIPGLAYELVPDRSVRLRENRLGFPPGTAISTNSHGMRDDEPLEGNEETITRIAVLGDSFTFGFGVKDREPYPRKLEGLLNRKHAESGKQFDVLNFGVGGYSSRDEALVLEHKVLPWNPRLLLAGYALNDPEIASTQQLHAYFAEEQWWQKFHALRLLASAKHEWEVRLRGDGDYYQFLHAPGSSRWQSVLDAFARIHELAAARNLPVLVVIFPVQTNDRWEDYPYANLHEQVALAATEQGLDVLDLLPLFQQHDPVAMRVSESNHHPSAEAHKIAAETIRHHLEENYPEVLR